MPIGGGSQHLELILACTSTLYIVQTSESHLCCLFYVYENMTGDTDLALRVLAKTSQSPLEIKGASIQIKTKQQRGDFQETQCGSHFSDL